MKNIFFSKRQFTLATLPVLLAPTLLIAQPVPKEALEEVLIVGSRIARSADFDGPIPVQTIDRNSIEQSGYNNLQQLLEKIPSAGNGTFSTRGNNQDSSASGASAISLRGLGADATLVLVNGRRVAISSFAESVTTNFVDINSIPLAAIERVEVLKDGASAVYGSDAVAGVVNIVLRKDFEGFEVTAGYGNTLDTDNDEKTFSAIWGINGDNNSNVTFIFDYVKNSTLMNKDRGHIGSADQSNLGGQDFRSSRGFPGRFIVDGTTTIDPNCPADNSAGDTCVYDYGPWNLLIPEAERTGLTFLGHRDLADKLEIFTEIAVQHNTSIVQGAPTPLDEEALLSVPLDHPNNPFGDVSSIDVGRYRTVDAGPRQWDVETDNLRMVLGFRGEINQWKWELSAQRARSESMQTGSRSQGWVRTDFLQTQIDAGLYNPFGGTYNPQSVIDEITTSLVRVGKSELSSLEALVNTEFAEMAGGTAAVALGLEYRDESISDLPDDQFQRGLIFGTESVSASAKRDISSAFIEISLPILSTVSMTLAARYDEYSDFGSTANPMVNMRWAATEKISLRASWGTGFRAPSLAQIGLGPSQQSQFFTDTYGCAINSAYCATTDYTINFSGNSELEPEKSESFNIGLIVEASEALRLSLDYWEITQEEKIDEVPFGYIYQQNCNDQNSTVCTRAAPLAGQPLGGLLLINSSFINIGEQSAKGIDLGVSFRSDFAQGELTLKLDYSYLAQFERVELDADGVSFISRDLAGEYEYPKHRWLASADWQASVWGLNANLNYTGEFEDTPDFDFDGTLDYQNHSSRTVDSLVTLNVQARFTGFANTRVSFGIDNTLDEDPPFAIGDGDSDLYGYVSSQHNPRGRFVYGKVSYFF